MTAAVTDETHETLVPPESGIRALARRHRWWITRLLALPVHLFFFAIAVFFLVRLVPGDPVLVVADGDVTPEQYADIQRQLGLDGSLLSQLGRFLGGLVTGDLGTSFVTNREVLPDLLERLPSTVELAALGVAGAVVASCLGGYLVVTRPRSRFARAARVYARTAGALPDFCLAVIGIVVFYVLLRWAPAPLGRMSTRMAAPPEVTGFSLLDALLTGHLPQFASILGHLALPVIVMIIAYTPLIMKQLVLGLEDAAVSQQVRFRIASGATRRAVVLSLYRRALPSAVIMGGSLFGGLFGGAVIMESLFSLGGMGQYAVDAVNSYDLPALQGFLLVTAAASLLVFLVVDLINMLLDPRRRPGVSTRED
jgi:ABC-type dipeptide/oligopeptide/nickel transport system permease component